MSQSDAEKWNARYSDRTEVAGKPLPFLQERVGRLGSGKALVLAAGLGHNAVFLAHNGFDVTALDISEVGLARCRELAESRGVSIQTVCADLDNYDLGERQYDLITKIYYYQLSLFPAIRTALKPSGRFLFHTFSDEHARVGTFGPRNPDYLAHQDDVLPPFASDRIEHFDQITLSDGEDTEAVIRMIVQV